MVGFCSAPRKLFASDLVFYQHFYLVLFSLLFVCFFPPRVTNGGGGGGGRGGGHEWLLYAFVYGVMSVCSPCVRVEGAGRLKVVFV